MKGIGSKLVKMEFIEQPKFCTMYHPVRKELGLTITEYVIIDGIARLSSKPSHPWCTQSKDAMADFMEVGRATIFRAIEKGIERGLLEKNDRGDLRATDEWVEAIYLYKQRTGQKAV